MSRITVLKLLGDNILIGIESANPIVKELDPNFIPNVGPIITEVGRIITLLEISWYSNSEEVMGKLIQSLTTANVIKQVSTTSPKLEKENA